MAKKNLKKINSELEETKKKLASLEDEKRAVEENLQKQIGKYYAQIQFKKSKNQSYETILEDIKMELEILKEEDKKRRDLIKKEREKEDSLT